MNKQMIENSDRGITLNKSLAWTILAALVGGGFWMGVQMTETREGVRSLEARQAEDRAAIRANAVEINALARSNARIDQRLLTIEQSARRTEESVQEVLRYLRSTNGDERR
jgi:glucose-6-phosphate-specific signal transduction histidine kinase